VFAWVDSCGQAVVFEWSPSEWNRTVPEREEVFSWALLWHAEGSR